jgi:hypothetical protein
MPMTRKQADEIMKVLRELDALNGKKIVEKDDDAKRATLTTFITQAMFANAPELMGTWVAMKAEYEPLILGFSGMMARVNNILFERERRETELAEAK